MPWINSRASSFVSVPSASITQSARQLRQKAGKAHQVDILGIVAVLQMRDEAAEGCGCGGV